MSADAQRRDAGEPPRLERRGAIATLCLRRPARRNSLTPGDLRAIRQALQALNQDQAIRVLVLAADTQDQERPVFCAGYQIDGFDGADHDPLLFEQTVDAIEAARPLTLCALSGSVFGGATDLALACDFRVGLAGASWRMPACALGLHYYPSGLRRYVSRLGLNFSKRLFLLGEAVPFEDLQRCGLFEAVPTDRAAFDTAVAALAQSLGDMAPLAAQATKQSLNELAHGLFDEQRLRQRELMTLSSADFAEGRAAFAQRRAPRFNGR
jgi:enoyl-CoA hydratase/carnithine racemase